MTDLPPILVFDLDGTLADTAPDLLATLDMLLAREGLTPPPPALARVMVGQGARALIERGFAYNDARLDALRLDALVADFLAHYEAHIADATRLFPGAAASLARLSGAGFALAVCTNKPERLARLLLQKLGVAEIFAAICGRETFPVCKPDAGALLMTIDAAAGDRGRAVMVGDSANDVDAARNAKIPSIAVDFGYTEAPVALLSPDRVISHFDELFEAAASLLAASAPTPLLTDRPRLF